MKLQKIFITACIILAFAFFSHVLAKDSEDLKDQEKIKMLMDAADHAAFPAESMRIKFVYEDVHPQRVSFRKRPANEYTKFKRDYTITISDIRSRVEWYEEIFKPRKNIEGPAFTKNVIMVFDGTWQLDLKDMTKSPNPQTKGSKYANDKNSSRIRKELFCWPFDLRRVVSNKSYPCELVESNESGIYIVDVGYEDTGARYRFTIDSNKGYNITKYKFIRKDGSLINEANYEIKKLPDGTWYMAGYELIRHPRLGKEGEPKINHRVKVTKAEFNIDVPDETFKLEFPTGTKIWDFIIKDWYYVGTPEGGGFLDKAKYTEEDPKVSAILSNERNREKQTDADEVFGAVKESIVNSIEHRKDCFIDFDTGKCFSMPSDFRLNAESAEKWFMQNSVDGKVETDEGLSGIWTFNTVVVPVRNERWNTITPKNCNGALENVKGVDPPIMGAEGKLPATFLFQTWENSGILQILEVQREKEPSFIRVRYKIIKEAQDEER